MMLMLGKEWNIKLSLLLIVAVIISLIAQASVNRDLTQADSPDPETTIDPILDYVEDVDTINGSATDTAGSISSVEIQINRSDDSNFWNSSAWQDSPWPWPCGCSRQALKRLTCAASRWRAFSGARPGRLF